MDGAISQLHSIRNGYNRPNNTIPRHSQKSNWTTMQWQLQQQQQQQHQQPPPNAHYMMQKTGSESGSSTGDMSPPPSSIDSAGIHGNANQSQSSGLRAQAVNLSRLNGAPLHASNSTNSLEFNGSPASANAGTTLVTSNSSGNLLLVGAPLHNFPTYRTIPATIQQRQQFPAQVNGEINIYPTPFPNATFISPATAQQQQRASPSQTAILPTAYPTNKLVQSCFNCGSINHTGLNCSEASMEDVTRNAVYKLDYTVSTQSPFTPVAVMTSSSSSGNLNAANNNVNSSDPQLESSTIFIDLTQDTSSDSSISNR